MKHQTIERTASEPLSNAHSTISAVRLLDVVVGFSRKMNTQPKDDSWVDALKAALNEIGVVVPYIDLNTAARPLPEDAKSGDVLFGRSFVDTTADDHAQPKASGNLTIVLDGSSYDQAVISIGFETQPRVLALDQITILAGALSQVWRDRVIYNTGKADNILSIDNPCGLTRSETRVCYALKEGMSPTKIADDFGIGIATVRTHLSNIYAKTGLPSQTAVVRQLSIASQTELRATP